jgi:hypothetical protein
MFLSTFRRWLNHFAFARRDHACPRPVRFRPWCEPLDERLAPAVITWTGGHAGVDNNWTDSLNWSPQQVPGPGDTADFTGGASSIVCNIDQSATVASIIMDSAWATMGGTVNAQANLTVTGDFIMDGDIFEGNGAVTIGGSNSTWGEGAILLGTGGLTNNGTLTMSGNKSISLGGTGTLTNNGTINEGLTSGMSINSGAVLNNTGTLDFTADASISNGGGGTITSTGTVEKTGGTGTSSITCALNSTGGTIDAESGTLWIGVAAGGTINGSTLKVGVGGSTSAVLDLSSVGYAPVTYTGSVTGSGSGTIALKFGTMQIAAAGATFNFPGAMFQWSGGNIDDSSGGTLTNASTGVFNINNPTGDVAFVGSTSLGGTLANRGTINKAGTSYSLVLENTATLSNAGTFDFTGDTPAGGIGQSGGGTLTSSGTLEKTGGTATCTIDSSFVNSGAITVQTGTLVLLSAGGTSTGGTFNVSKGATLDLTGGTTVAYQGSYTGSGAGTVALEHGTLQVAPGGATFNMSGTLFQWTGGTIDVTAGSLTNAGTINISGTGYVYLKGANSLMNNKSILQTSTGNGTLWLSNNATLNNTNKGTYNLQGDGAIAQSGGGTFLNAGTLVKSKGTGTSTFSPSTLSNTGTVVAASGTVDISATVTQVSGSTLTAGTWTVNGSPTVHATLEISSAGSFSTIGSAAKVTLSGPNTSFTNLGGLTTIAKGGSFTLAGNQSFSTTGALTNGGSVTLSPGSVLTVSGSFTEAATGKLTLQMGAVSGTDEIGTVVSSTGTVSLAGTLSVTSTVVPAVGSSFTIVDHEGSSVVNGTFTGLTEGATFTVKKGTTTMTFQISYVGNDGHGTNNVVITRLS